MLPIINPWLAMKAGRALGEMIVDSSNIAIKEERLAQEEINRKKREKEVEKTQKKIAIEEAERKLRLENPHYTWLFNHFDYGNEYVYYKTLY